MSDLTGNDTVELGELFGALRRRWGWIVGGVVVGVALSVVGIWVLRSEYTGTTTVLVRDSKDAAGGALGALAGLTDMIPGGALGGAMTSTLDTEMEILTSRTVIGEVVDTLGLQFDVRKPEGVAPREIFAAFQVQADVPEGVAYEFTRVGDVYDVKGPNGITQARPGQSLQLAGAVVTLAPSGLPESFAVRILDREDAIDEVVDDLEAEEAAGEVVELVYKGPDPYTAAAVPNLMVAKFLGRRQTVDRGINQHRYEFLEAHLDSVRQELSQAEDALRRHQEVSGVLDPELSGTTGVERAMTLQAELETVDVESRSLQEVLALQRGGASPRQLAAYPTFLKNPAINGVLDRMLELETERVELLSRRTERDPEVMALTDGVQNLENQLSTLSRDYLIGLERQKAQLQQELRRYDGILGALPSQAQESLRHQRDVKRLSETMIVMQAQLVQTKLAAMGEGGEVRQIDVAQPPKRASFPSVPLFLAVGLIAGLLLGAGGALSKEYLSSSIREPHQAELATGLPAVALRSGVPLLLGGIGSGGQRSLLVIPVGKGASAAGVAEQLAGTASLRGLDVALLDVEDAAPGVARLPRGRRALPAGEGPTVPVSLPPVREEEDAVPVMRLGKGDPVDPAEMRAMVSQLEDRLELVVVALGGLDSPLTMSVLTEGRPVILAARAGGANRQELREAVDTLRRAGMLVSGVILHNGSGHGHPGA